MGWWNSEAREKKKAEKLQQNLEEWIERDFYDFVKAVAELMDLHGKKITIGDLSVKINRVLDHQRSLTKDAFRTFRTEKHLNQLTQKLPPKVKGYVNEAEALLHLFFREEESLFEELKRVRDDAYNLGRTKVGFFSSPDEIKIRADLEKLEEKAGGMKKLLTAVLLREKRVMQAIKEEELTRVSMPPFG